MNIKNLQQWYIENHRKLPFRESKDPYDIWVSEVMLQQTQVDTVIPYFNRFISRYPNIYELAKTDEETLFSLIQGLGYYRRFKNMLKAAKFIVSELQGVFPSTYKEILNLPGIGDYTAGAIMSIAYNKPYNATDGNVIRVLSRIHDISDDMRIENNKKQLVKINQSYIEKSTPNIYTQAIMELGALICKPTNPKCNECPMMDDCLAYKYDKQEVLPYLSKKPIKKQINYKVFIIKEGNSIYLRKRTELLLGGMYEFPQYSEEDNIPFDYEITKELGHKKHVFTHLVWNMFVYEINILSKPMGDWLKINIDELDQYPMAKAHKKITDFI